MESHEADLRSEVNDDAKVRALQENYRAVDLGPRTRTLLDFAEKLTRMPATMNAADIESLRQVGFADEQIIDAVQLVGYFNYSNRVMDALGIRPEPEMRYRNTS